MVMIEATWGGNPSLPDRDASSATGYTDGQRIMVMPSAYDSCHWIIHAQRMAAEGLWRVRDMPYDNAPHGRELHWSQSVSWILLAAGVVTSQFTGMPVGAAIELAAAFALPVVFLFLLALVPWLAARWVGRTAAGVLCLGMACSFPFVSNFAVGSPDHHGLVMTALLVAVLALGAKGFGWGRPTRRMRSAFFLGGIATATGMWISAATMIPALVGLGAGAFLVMLLYGARGPGFDEGAWRVWGWTSCAFALFFYALEYFPSHLGFRLEVNHPLYALALVGGGEILARTAAWRRRGGSVVRSAPEAVCWLAAIASVLAPLVVMRLCGTDVFVVSDRFLWQLHRDYIAEFKPFTEWLAGMPSLAVPTVLSFLPLLLLLCVLLFRVPLPLRFKAALWGLAVPSVLVTCLGLLQIRWLYVSCALWLPFAAVLMRVLMRHLPGAVPARLAAAPILAVTLLAFPARAFVEAWQVWKDGVVLRPDETVAVSARQVAYHLHALSGGESETVVSSPTMTTWMIYFGGLKGLGTLYWENLGGLRAAAGLYASSEDADALERIGETRAAFIVIPCYEAFASEYPALAGTRVNQEATLSQRLADGREIPSWARPVPVPVHEGLGGGWINVFDVRSARDSR